MGFAHLPVLWLESVHRSQSHVVEHNESIQLAAGGSSAVQLPSTNSVLPSEYLFPILLLVRIGGFIGMDAALVLLDAAGLAMTTKHGGDFGKQKMWSTMSMVIVPTLCGLLIDAISEKLGSKLTLLFPFIEAIDRSSTTILSQDTRIIRLPSTSPPHSLLSSYPFWPRWKSKFTKTTNRSLKRRKKSSE